MKRLLLLVGLAAGALARVGPAAAFDVPPPPGPGESPALDPRFVEAMKGRDMRAVGAGYADDAILLGPDGAVVSGREAIARYWKDQAGRGLRDLRLTDRRSYSWGTLGYEMGTYELRTAGPRGEKTESGEFLSVFKREADGRWRVVYDVLNSLPPASPAPRPR